MAGIWTGEIGAQLTARFADRGLQVYYDHPQNGTASLENAGRIVAWYGSEHKRESQLTFIDIAIVYRASNHALALIEIEETTSKPKVLLGDVLATLLGDQITFKGNPLLISADTLFLILTKGTERDERIQFLQEQVNALRPHLKTPNSNVGQIVIDTFSDEDDLEKKLIQYLEPKVA
jgi:hypothetical protein